ncbi:UDP-glucosyltransferase 2-like isoform X1 [Maniola jurtina]|uniref:UDP-glucosyltransferase 2-like isoform X1 n=1 Tax=Maniola jurtina TaxID=191418 RepID=UPI001E68F9B1|nr:UDP-glucosyltransferase 2-like isoform X1 [Maniola jurtina]XP_045782073.1 UDP-glucosyltransferase 2-like isoform X1 [Maniola jurtina]
MKLAVLLSVISTGYAYNILCLQNVPSKSHYHLVKGLIFPLLEAGHKVTWITTFPGKPVTNLTYIDISHIQELTRHLDMTNPNSQNLDMVKEFARNITRSTLQTPGVRNALINEKFDAVVTEWFFSEVETGYAAVQDAPWILLCGMVLHSHLEYLVDTVRSVPTIPILTSHYDTPMTLWQRIQNTLSYLSFTYHTMSSQPINKANYEEYFEPLAKARGVTLPPYDEAMHNVSIMFVNSHPSFAPPFVTPPNVVDIAGYHIDEDVPPLPKDLQDLLDSSRQGVVYFSMGSVVRSAALPAQTQRELVKMLGELPYTVLWKFEEKMEGLPRNLHIRPWMPQSSILSHPNVKVFITHGGLLSTLESLHFGVPVIAVPVFGDQPSNALRCVRAGHALKVDFNLPELAGNLKTALDEMLNNNSYYNRAKEISRLFRKRPVSNKKLIQHYVELAIESKGARHLRSNSLMYSWYQLWMLDQLAVLILALFIIAIIIKKILSNLFRKKGKPSTGKKDKKK